MLKLPFKSYPKAFERITVGNSEIGELELPKYADLSPNERIFIKEKTALIPDIRNSAIKMARAIATKSGKRMVELYNALVSSDSEVLGDYLEELVEFQQLMEESSRQRNLVTATAVIKFRLVADWDIENSSDAEQIHPQLVEAIAQFARNEESGWKDVKPTTEDDLGNSTIPQANPTGEKSSGDAEDTGVTTEGSDLKTSATSQPG